MILIVRAAKDYVPLKIEDIAIIKACNKRACVIDRYGQKFKIGLNLQQLEKKLNSHSFFRANRQTIINMHFIKSFKTLERKGIELQMQYGEKVEIVHISLERMSVFNKWIEAKQL